MHLVLMLSTFFIMYYVILVSVTYLYYRATFRDLVRPYLSISNYTLQGCQTPTNCTILDERLENFAKSTATSLYHMDELGIR